MGEVIGTIARAIDPPASRVLPASGARRHRPLTGTAGILLFVCMFLPAMKGCGNATVAPLDVPPFIPPYLYGLVFAAVALAKTPRQLFAGVVALRVLATIVAFAGFIVFLIAPSIGVVELLVGLTLISTIGTQGASEARIALTALVLGVVCVVWFGMWTLAEDALLGVKLSLASSVGLVVGAGVWLVELWIAPPATVPRAVLRYARDHEGSVRRPGARARV